MTLCLLAGTSAFAQDRRAPRTKERPTAEQMAQRKTDRMVEKLNLNEDQSKQLYELNLQEVKDMQAQHERMRAARKAKAEGLNVTCETGPHYLLLDDSCLQEDGRFKMNPPLRDNADREALLEGLADGTIDMIATDHAPHSPDQKGRGVEKTAMGIVGLETAFPLLYTYLVKPGVISMERLMELLHDAPCRRFNIPTDTGFTVFDLNDSYRVDPTDFLSMGKATPFTGWEVQGRCLLTATGETAVWYDKNRLLKGE